MRRVCVLGCRYFFRGYLGWMVGGVNFWISGFRKGTVEVGLEHLLCGILAFHILGDFRVDCFGCLLGALGSALVGGHASRLVV